MFWGDGLRNAASADVKFGRLELFCLQTFSSGVTASVSALERRNGSVKRLKVAVLCKREPGRREALRNLPVD